MIYLPTAGSIKPMLNAIQKLVRMAQQEQAHLPSMSNIARLKLIWTHLLQLDEYQGDRKVATDRSSNKIDRLSE
jgi:hypothetical protein